MSILVALSIFNDELFSNMYNDPSCTCSFKRFLIEICFYQSLTTAFESVISFKHAFALFVLIEQSIIFFRIDNVVHLREISSKLRHIILKLFY